MTQQEVFLKAIRMFEEMKINYMICGSIAAIAYGKPRTTNDMDVVIALRPGDVPRFEQAYAAEGFYCPPNEAILAEVRRGGQFNLVHQETGQKIDLFLLGRDDFMLTEFKRRQKLRYAETDFRAWFSRPEDVIVKKLEYFKQGGSEKHLSDIRNMLKISGDEIDLGYVRQWVRELGLDAEWKKVSA